MQCNNLLFPPKPMIRFPLPQRQLVSFGTKPKTSSGYHRKLSFHGCCSPTSTARSDPDDFDAELGRLLALLPGQMKQRLSQHSELHQLIEVVMDLGRNPLARFPTGEFVLSDLPITVQDLEFAASQVGDFAIDNRAGISRTLHRISAIRNRKGSIVGLTCRVGRAITGSANLLRSLVEDGASLLLIGPPGVGKTTIIREIARMLANDFEKRVMIVDTSNEIGGDGDIPHSGIGNARRMQVPNSAMQHEVLIEAVENHMPQVIVIDEISTKLEAMAASTIAQRGIQLVATAHGVTIRNLINNPSLEMLVGGIQSVTLGDEEANRRGVQKSVLERKGPATFSCAVEIVSKTELRVRRSLETTVDAILSGRPPYVEVRKISSDESSEAIEREPFVFDSSDTEDESIDEEIITDLAETRTFFADNTPDISPNVREESDEETIPVRLFVYGILEASVIQGIRQLKMDDSALSLTNNISEADALLGLQAKLKKNPGIQAAARSHNIPVYMTKTSSLVQIRMVIRAIMSDHEDSLKDIGSDKVKSSEKSDALEEVRLAIEQVVIPTGEAVELLPRPHRIMSLQLNLIRRYELKAERIGSGSNVRLRILPFTTTPIINDTEEEDDDLIFGSESNHFGNGNGNKSNGSAYIVDRLPLLPE